MRRTATATRAAAAAAISCSLLVGCTGAAARPATNSATAASAGPSSVPPSSAASTSPSASPSTSALTDPRTTAPATTRAIARPGCLRTVTIGFSVRHRAITACERGTPGGTALVVVGNIHGDERIGWRVVDQLMTAGVPAGVDLWLVRGVNPDGSAAGGRTNAHGVDENRNFPADWQLTAPGSATYGGPSALSEPETAAFAHWLLQLRPRTVVVMHSPLDAVDYSDGADPAVTRYLASASGFAARRLGSRPGALTAWFNAQAWHGTALTFEFARTASTTQVSRVARALLQLGRWRAATR